MSFDISIWSVDERISRREAIAISDEICSNEDAMPCGLCASVSVADFRMELEKTYPLEPTATCPWASDFLQTSSHITLFCAYSRSAEIVRFVLPLAHRHGLSIFDDRTQLIYLAPKLVELSDCTVESPCLPQPIIAYPEIITDILDVLPRRRNPYLIVTRADNIYMQAYWTVSGFVLEFREGSAQAHYRATHGLASDVVARIIHQYVRNESWQTATAFEKVEF